jgi:hypothetical protein
LIQAVQAVGFANAGDDWRFAGSVIICPYGGAEMTSHRVRAFPGILESKEAS